MLPPEWVVAEVVRARPAFRLAWLGGVFDPDVHRDSLWDFLHTQAKQEVGDDANVGQFFLLEILSKRGSNFTNRAPWANAGPVFGPSYDPLCKVPVIVMPLTKQAVFSGAVIKVVRDLSVDWRVQQKASAREADYQMRQDRMAVYQEAGERLWHRANQASSTHTVVARKFIPREVQAAAAGDVAPSRMDTYHQDSVGR